MVATRLVNDRYIVVSSLCQNGFVTRTVLDDELVVVITTLAGKSAIGGGVAINQIVGLADRAQVVVSRLNRLCDHQTCALSCGAAELVNRAVIAVAALRDFCGCDDGVSSTSRIGIVANALRNGCGIPITDLLNDIGRA